jgi:hypothetical protein
MTSLRKTYKRDPFAPLTPSAVRWYMVLVCFLILTASTLRFLYLGNVFHSSDNVDLPLRIIFNSGYWWMLMEPYGVLINLLAKLFTGLISALGTNITEFWWKAPVAAVGVLQVPLTFFFLTRLGTSDVIAFFGAAYIAVLPLHVMQSRYTWGYEVLGVFFVTLAIWALLNFFEYPRLTTGLMASLFCGLYLISHGYILPFIPCAIILVLLFAGNDEQNPRVLSRLTEGIRLAVRKKVYFFPLLFLPMLCAPILHTLRRPTRPGFYLFDHITGFINNIGIPLALLMLFAALSSVFVKHSRSKQSLLLFSCGVAYLAPLFLGAPRGITVARGYMLMGIYFWLLATLVVMDALRSKWNKKLIPALLGVCLILTLYGTVESLFMRDQWFDPTYVKVERGGLPPDPGTKTAGYFLRELASTSHKVLALHRNVELPNLAYYFGRGEYAYYDLSLEETYARYLEMREMVDIVIADREQLPFLEADRRFTQRLVVFSEGVPRMWIYAKPDVELPTLQVDAGEFNSCYDQEYPLYITLSPSRPGGSWGNPD